MVTQEKINKYLYENRIKRFNVAAVYACDCIPGDVIRHLSLHFRISLEESEHYYKVWHEWYMKEGYKESLYKTF